MASSLSAYWVKFFKGAGFPQDVATKHAVVFSNNRIKPDMLPDLDKPSLKEMGITLMGDMIAILRYAKKVVEETTCERFLVDTEDNVGTPKPIVKKIATKATSSTSKIINSKLKSDILTTKKIVKIPTSSVKKTVIPKKPISTSGEIITDLANQKKQTILKRKLKEDNEFDSNNEDEWQEPSKKIKSLDNKDNKVGYTIILPKGSTSRSQQILKKSEQKRTVFDRLGDSSVTSTTNPTETLPTFNITGLGKDVFKRSVSVFNRLGDKDAKKDNTMIQTGILKNGTNNTGILKTRSPSSRTSILTTNKVVKKNMGTMRADQEANRKVMSNNVTQLVKTTKRISFNTSSRDNRIIKSNITSGKLASERLTTIPAKARLGVIKTNGAKQVTFDRITTVAHVKKPDVFSRLGI
ncbi:hypothetical protein HZU73_04792 [Apis mellifera caucasica]|uniref:Uncharacterized protein C19orf47 homolog n=1 Tax=Apis mellifera TaxID=7460 RepID=A0A7M7GBG4_APIME|nr:uncharacterized protein C19orf47 homolog [Apis mellifera]KAG6799984.1 hypothetical protein HZU73_04792 [Apis mellifera caucasica]|eukprot:XP_003251533.1 uncharacterized protein C19orf47 homolog [Apis mellifera]